MPSVGCPLVKYIVRFSDWSYTVDDHQLKSDLVLGVEAQVPVNPNLARAAGGWRMESSEPWSTGEDSLSVTPATVPSNRWFLAAHVERASRPAPAPNGTDKATPLRWRTSVLCPDDGDGLRRYSGLRLSRPKDM